MGLDHSPLIVTDGLSLYADAVNTRSYAGSGYYCKWSCKWYRSYFSKWCRFWYYRNKLFLFLMALMTICLLVFQMLVIRCQ